MKNKIIYQNEVYALDIVMKKALYSKWVVLIWRKMLKILSKMD